MVQQFCSLFQLRKQILKWNLKFENEKAVQGTQGNQDHSTCLTTSQFQKKKKNTGWSKLAYSSVCGRLSQAKCLVKLLKYFHPVVTFSLLFVISNLLFLTVQSSPHSIPVVLKLRTQIDFWPRGSSVSAAKYHRNEVHTAEHFLRS